MNALRTITCLASLVGAAALGMAPPSRDLHFPPDARGPEVVVLDQVPGCYGSVRFNHRLHTGMAAINGGCANCHHHEPVDGVIQPCRACHADHSTAIRSGQPGLDPLDPLDKPSLRGAYHRHCLSCHKEWTHTNACTSCHEDASALAGLSVRRGPVVKPSLPPHLTPEDTYLFKTDHKTMPTVTFHHTDHAERFGLRCADCHGGTACGQCHGDRAERPVVRRQQDCYGCHNQKRCVTCHNVGEREHFDHARATGWVLRPGHLGLPCLSCHEQARMPEKASSIACRTCHAKQAGGGFDHSQVTGVVLYGDHETFECTACHAGGTDHALARCDGCHKERPIEGKREVGKTTASQ